MKKKEDTRKAELKRILLAHRSVADGKMKDKIAETRQAGKGEKIADEWHGSADDISPQLGQALYEELLVIDAALGRLEQDLYGRCSECGQDIEMKRLNALPFAIRCKMCEEDHEEAVKALRRKRR
ncbi:MAG: TraR/DksA C4-type zinc finger protein [Patescibacteria group bacterium]